ncbi:hypothetical protein FRC17_001556 [Serendipita sp. 399]|nr:hypothetical protein FRC17_001556 [Serendipita sp. 399]
MQSAEDSSGDSNDENSEETAESTDDEEDIPGPSLELSSKREISRFLRDLLLSANLDWKGMDNSWADLPKMMIRRKLYLKGLPRICTPHIVNDEVHTDSLPSFWAPVQQDEFLRAARSGSMKFARRETDEAVLFEVRNDDGTSRQTALQYSLSWVQRNIQSPLVTNERVLQRQRQRREGRAYDERSSKLPPNAVITSSGRGWVVVEESTEEEEDSPTYEHPKSIRKQLRMQATERVLKQIVEWDIRGDSSEVTWNALPLALAQNNKYVTGLPPAALPKVRDDKVIFQASHPCLWSGEMITRVLRIVDEGKFQVLPRPPGRIVLFETFDVDGNPYDSTIGFSDEWIALNILDKSLAAQRETALRKEEQKRAKAEAREKQERKKEENKPGRPTMLSTSKRTSGILSERERRIAHNAKVRQELDQGRANAQAAARKWHNVGTHDKTSRPSIQAIYAGTFSEASTPRSNSPLSSRPGVAPMETEPPPMHPRHAFKGKQRASNTSNALSVGMTGESSWRNVDTLMSSPPHAPLTDSQSSHWSPSMSKIEPTSIAPSKRQHNWPPPGYPKIEWELVNKNSVINRLSRFFDRHQLGTEPTAIPWKVLPRLLAERRQYLRGVPFVCIPSITDDQVNEMSAPWNWNGEQLGAMDWALSSNTLSINARETGRRVLFEIIGEQGSFSDSTLGYSARWLDRYLPDTNPNLSSPDQSFNEPLTPIVSLKRPREVQDSPLSPEGISIDRDSKRRRQLDTNSTTSPLESHPGVKVEPKEKSFLERSWRDSSSGSNETGVEEAIDARKLSFNRLVPNSLPPPLLKGRVFLRFGPVDGASKPNNGKEAEEETWEWIPPAGTSMGMKSSTVWNPTQARWRLVPGGRSLENLGSVERKERTEFPDRTDGIILSFGTCDYVEERGQWEMIPHKHLGSPPWRIRWDEIYARWEWTQLP